jgi:hypothetical protein
MRGERDSIIKTDTTATKCGSTLSSPLYKPLPFKGTVSRDFLLLVFFINQFPPIWANSKFFENSRRYSQLKVDHRCRWHRWQMKKIFNQKNFNNFVGTPLDSRGNTDIHFCLQVHLKVSAAWYYSLYIFATGINNTSKTGGKICRRCRWYRWSTLSCKYLREFSRKFETALMVYSGAWGKLIHEKN